MSSSSSSSGGSISSSGSSSLSPYYSSDDDNCNDDDEDNDGDDEGSESDYSHAEDENLENCRDASSDARSNGIDSSSFSYYGNSNSSSSSNSKHRGGHRQRPIVDYYDGQRHRTGEHAGLLPPAPAPAIVPMADRSAIEYEARQRRWERHVDKRRQSLNGSQPPPTPRRKKRKKAKDLRKQVLLKNAQYLAD
ncbi:hypothetical protein BGX31_008204 [Mortierella sp. GBA43]|nr:hypothetical protein BGX31_008204 [Mortierella sp. GBA43]